MRRRDEENQAAAAKPGASTILRGRFVGRRVEAQRPESKFKRFTRTR